MLLLVINTKVSIPSLGQRSKLTHKQNQPPNLKALLPNLRLRNGLIARFQRKMIHHVNTPLLTMVHFVLILTGIISLLMAVVATLAMLLVVTSKQPIKLAGLLQSIVVLTSTSLYSLIMARIGVAPTMRWRCSH